MSLFLLTLEAACLIFLSMNAARFSSPSNATVKHACKAILSGDFERARAELGTGYSIAPVQGRMIIGSLREAARRFNAPHLAERSPLNI